MTARGLYLSMFSRASRFSVAVTRWTWSNDQHSYSTLGPVSAEWVTVFWRVNHLGAGTQAYSAWASPLWLGWNEYPGESWGSKQAYRVTDTPDRIRGLAVWCWCWLYGLASGDQRRLAGSGSASEACALYKSTVTLRTYFTVVIWPVKRGHFWLLILADGFLRHL